MCKSKLREAFLICEAYANERDGFGPAIGRLYHKPPSWVLVVQAEAGVKGDSPDELYISRSVLVCPEAAAHSSRAMTRAYAMNATGRAGLPGVPDDCDDEAGAFIRFDFVERRSDTLLLLDCAVAFIPDGAPPPRSASMVDFRQAGQISARLG